MKMKSLTLFLLAFIMSGLSAYAGFYEMNNVSGRYIRLEIPGDNKQLRFSEIQVFSNGVNVSQGKSPEESNTTSPQRMSSIFNNFWQYDSRYATDANTDETKGVRTAYQSNPWFYLDLGREYDIDKILIYSSSGVFNGVTMKVGPNADGSDANYTVVNIAQDEVISFEPSADAVAKNSIGDIWMIGDQINLGSQDADTTSSPRSKFYSKMVAAGYEFSFTGHLTSNSEGITGADYTSHSCIDNAKISDFSGKLATFWNQGRLATVKPEVVCLMLGTNDIDADLIADTPERMKALLDELYALPGIGNPIVLVGGIPPNQTFERKKTNVNIYNEGIQNVVRSFQVAGKDNILFIDHFNALGGENTNLVLRFLQEDSTSEFGPGINLNATGNRIVGELWQAELSRYVTTYGIPEDPWIFPKTDCVRSLVDGQAGYYEYFFNLGSGVSFSVIPPPVGVVHSSGKKPWMWRNIFYASNTGSSLTNDMPLINEGFYSVNIYGSVTGHASGNDKVKAAYDYLTETYGFAPTFSASAMSRAGFMVMRFANEYPDLIEGILMDNACSDGLSWPVGRSYTSAMEYAPGKFYAADGSNGSADLYVQHYSEYTTMEEVMQHLAYDSPLQQIGPLAESGVKILSICGSSDHAVPIASNDLALQRDYESLGGDFTLIVEDKGHRHGQATAATKAAFHDFVRDNVFRVPNTHSATKAYTITFELGEGSRTGGGALSQSVTRGQSATAPTITPPAGYTFSGWSSSLEDVLSDRVIAAVYRRNSGIYTVNFELSSGTHTGGGALTQSIQLNEAAVEPTFDAPAGYTFTGWNSRFDDISGDRIITALYSLNGKTSSDMSVTFDLNGGTRTGGGALSQFVPKGTPSEVPTFTPPVGFIFSGWSSTPDLINSDIIISAQYEPASGTSYNVTFDLGNGSRSGGGALNQTVSEGGAAIAPTVTPPAGYTFSGWDRTFTNVTGNLTVTAQYTESTTGSGTTITNGTGRYVRITIPTAGTSKMKLYLEEVEIYVGGSNIATSGTATQSSDLTSSYSADNAVDQGDGAFTNSATNWDQNPWWEVDLGSTVNIESIVITNVTGGDASKLDNFTVTIYDANRNPVHVAEGLPTAAVTTLTSGEEEMINGIPASWLTANGYPLTVAATNTDNDGDGHTALQEYLAGTNPNSRSSRFRMRGCRKNGNQVSLDWSSVSGKSYTILHSPDMTSGSWTVVQSGITGESDATSFIINAQNSGQFRGFYRIEVSN